MRAVEIGTGKLADPVDRVGTHGQGCAVLGGQVEILLRAADGDSLNPD